MISFKAKIMVETMRRQEGFLTLAQARHNREAMNELQEKLLIVSGKKDGIEGYKFTLKGKEINGESPEKEVQG